MLQPGEGKLAGEAVCNFTRSSASRLNLNDPFLNRFSEAGANVKMEEFAAAIIVLIEDEDAVRRASRRDLAIVEGVLSAILSSVTAELQQREQARGNNP